MYGFEPSDEQKMLVGAVQKYAGKDLRGAAHDADEQGSFPDGILQRGWELGILQASIPEAYGGFGDRSAVTGALAAEELAWGDVAGALVVQEAITFVFGQRFATPDHGQRHLIADRGCPSRAAAAPHRRWPSPAD